MCTASWFLAVGDTGVVSIDFLTSKVGCVWKPKCIETHALQDAIGVQPKRLSFRILPFWLIDPIPDMPDWMQSQLE